MTGISLRQDDLRASFCDSHRREIVQPKNLMPALLRLPCNASSLWTGPCPIVRWTQPPFHSAFPLPSSEPHEEGKCRLFQFQFHLRVPVRDLQIEDSVRIRGYVRCPDTPPSISPCGQGKGAEKNSD